MGLQQLIGELPVPNEGAAQKLLHGRPGCARCMDVPSTDKIICLGVEFSTWCLTLASPPDGQHTHFWARVIPQQRLGCCSKAPCAARPPWGFGNVSIALKAALPVPCWGRSPLGWADFSLVLKVCHVTGLLGPFCLCLSRASCVGRMGR